MGKEIAVPDEKPDTAERVNEMVKLFGSEKRKRAFSAAQKNQVEGEVLKTALEPAFTHAETKAGGSPPEGQGDPVNSLRLSVCLGDGSL